MKNLFSLITQVLFTLLFTLFGATLIAQHLYDVMPMPATEESLEVSEKILLRKENDFNKNVSKINLNKIRKIQKEDGKFTFKIPNDNTVYTAYSQYVKVEDDNNYQWNGEVRDKQNFTIGYITLAEMEGALFGEIHVYERSFVIEDFGTSQAGTKNGRISYLIEKDTEKTKDFKCGTIDTSSGLNLEKSEPKFDLELRAFCTRNVRVLVLFTNAANNVQNGNQAAVTFMNQANQTLRNSGITAEQLTFQLAASQLFTGIDDQINVQNNGVLTAESLRDILTANGPVMNLRDNTFDADLVILLTNNPTMTAGGVFGIAHLHNLNNRNRSHGIVQIGAPATRFSFVHEMAHNFGCKHDNDTRTTEGLTVYARGKAWTQNGINRRTIMALAGNLERIPNFSNPSVPFNGITTGDANQRDNARQLREQALKMSLYEQGQDPVEAVITGPGVIYNSSNLATWCATSCNLAITTYQWSYSSNGFTYINFGTNSNCASKAQNSFGTASTIYIRVITTFTNGQASTAVYPVTNRQDIQYLKGSDEKESKIVSSKLVINRLGVNIYPNPSAEGRIRLDLLVPVESELSIMVYTAQGHLEQVITRGKKYVAGVNYESIDVSGWAKGLKFIRVDNGLQQETLPVLIH